MQLDLFAADDPPEPDPSRPRIHLNSADTPPPRPERPAATPALSAAHRKHPPTRGLSPTSLALDVAEKSGLASIRPADGPTRRGVIPFALHPLSI